MKKLKNVQELFVEQLKDLHYKKSRQSKNLSELLIMTTSVKLKQMITRHIREADLQIRRLNVVFSKFNSELTKVEHTEIDKLITEIWETEKQQKYSENTNELVTKSLQEITYYEKNLVNTLQNSFKA